MLLCQETIQDNIGVNTVMPLVGPSGLYAEYGDDSESDTVLTTTNLWCFRCIPS